MTGSNEELTVEEPSIGDEAAIIPFVEKETGLVTPSLKKGITYLKQAIEEDYAENFEEAFKLYKNGLQCFLNALKYELTNQAVKSQVRAKVLQYLNRAEKLKADLIKNEKDNQSNDNKKESDKREINPQLQKEIVFESCNVPWDKVIGLEAAKQALKESVLLPIKFPNLFTGTKLPGKCTLLFGPPGTGKSYLAKAVATEANSSNFFSISSADLICKWHGEGLKVIKDTFRMASARKPSIILLEAIDFLFSNEDNNEHARKLKTEILCQISIHWHESDGVWVIGSTNTPWTLDYRVLKYFTKRIHIQLPEEDARTTLFKLYMENSVNELHEDDFKTLGEKTEGFSAAEIHQITREACLQPVYKVRDATHFRTVSGPSPTNKEQIVDLLTPCSPEVPEAIEMSFMQISENELLVPAVTLSDMLKILNKLKPIADVDYLKKMEKFKDDYS
ncbi:DgyrCDS3062 [Dimorphilus gyrociliatus]|uniref:DgyrCDS3062 n=1 Tax=Dimorphilus gyrociliatus TaxID=2664684 RepID=A0A7I8VDY9_9ANNE|nr:DgyrCDS3062 [Dimorphilus gyrociliatus]